MKRLGRSLSLSTAMVAAVTALVVAPVEADPLTKSMRVGRTTVTYKVVLPDGYDPATAYPAVLVFGGGPQTMNTVDGALERNFQSEAEQRGYIVVAPAAPNGRLFFEDGARIFPEFLDGILADYRIRDGKFHVAGPSNGGIAALHVAAANPDYFLSATAFPGYLWQASEAKLRAISNLCVFMYVGEHDRYMWHGEMEREAEFLRALGAVARYRVETGQPHRLETLAGANASRLFDDFEEARQGCRIEPARADPAEPDGFRMSDYNADVPAGVAGARVITEAAALRSLIAAVAPVLLDVYPAPERPAQLAADVLWIEPARETLPNALWLANVGMGPAPAELEALLADTLASATRGDKAAPVVIFCEPRCWHSWNAAKRAVLLGYTNVYWFKGGVEGWRAAGYPLETVHPQRPRAAPPEELAFAEVAEGLYVFEGDIADIFDSPHGMVANIAFVVGDAAVAVIDSGASARQGRLVRAAIREVTDLPIRYVINTHVHLDHIFGNQAFVADEPAFIAHRRFANELAAKGEYYLARLTADWYRDTAIIEATELLSEARDIDLGNRVITINVHERAHTHHDLSVYDARTDTLLAGDLVFVEHCPSLEGSVVGWIDTLNEIERASYTRVVPGHGPVQTDTSAIAKQRDYLERLASEVRAAIASRMDLQTASSTLMLDAADDWQLCDEFHARNVIRAFTELEWE